MGGAELLTVALLLDVAVSAVSDSSIFGRRSASVASIADIGMVTELEARDDLVVVSSLSMPGRLVLGAVIAAYRTTKMSDLELFLNKLNKHKILKSLFDMQR